MPAQRPVADSYAEVTRGPARDASDRSERRRWWSQTIRAATAFGFGLAAIQLWEFGDLPGTAPLEATPVYLVDPAALALGAAAFWAGRKHWPLRVAAAALDDAIDRCVR